MGLHPIPYYILAFVLLIAVRLRLAGAADQRRRADEPAAAPGCRLCRQRAAAFDPAAAVAGAGRDRRLVHGHARRWCPTSSPRTTLRLPNSAASAPRRILFSYVMRNALMPQVTGLAMSLGGIFNGAIITEQVFGYPGLGTPADRCGACRRLQPGAGHRHGLDHCGGDAVLLIDLLYPLLDPRARVG